LKIGYVRILQFMQPTAGELAQALDGLEEKGMQALVLDLRNNPGGLLNSAVDVCGEFLPGETTVVTTEVRSGENPPPYKTKKRPKGPRDFPLVILQNHSSASGSELTAGALQDLGRAIVVGEKSFGKGSVQTIIPSRDQSGTAVRLTTAKYFTPSHKVIHEHGIVPDITATLTPEEELRIFEWRRSRAQGNADPVQLAKLGDRQLERAVTALRGVMAFRARKQQPNGQPKPVEPPKPPENPAPSPAPPSASPAPTPAPVPAPEPQKANP
jgi:carboxyl-terminal processing protease